MLQMVKDIFFFFNFLIREKWQKFSWKNTICSLNIFYSSIFKIQNSKNHKGTQVDPSLAPHY
jgi:hypothetical protein